MKRLFYLLVFIAINKTMNAQVGIGTSSPASTAQLDIVSNKKGILIPRMTNMERDNNILDPVLGLLIFQTDDIPGFYYFDGKAWKSLAASAAGDEKQIQFMKDGVFAASPNFTWDNASNRLNIGKDGSLYLGETRFIHTSIPDIAPDDEDYLEDGTQNTFVGRQSGESITIGNYNTAMGTESLKRNTTGYGNTTMGSRALWNNTTGIFNNSFGYYSLVSNKTGRFNVAIGSHSLYRNEAGNYNTAIGNSSLNQNKGNYNTALGYNAGSYYADGSKNTYLGNNANASADSFSNATALGNEAMVTASNQIQLGNASVKLVNTSGTMKANGYITAIKTVTEYYTIQPEDDIINVAGRGIEISLPLAKAIGMKGRRFTINNTNEEESIEINAYYGEYIDGIEDKNSYGLRAHQSVTLVSDGANWYRTAIVNDIESAGGSVAGEDTQIQFNDEGSMSASEDFTWNNSNKQLNIGSTGSLFLGSNKFLHNYRDPNEYGSSYNTFVGLRAGQYNTTGNDNTAVGFRSLRNNTEGQRNTAMGKWALIDNVTGDNNTAIGTDALASNYSGSDNIAIGNQALFYNNAPDEDANPAKGNNNVAIGKSALEYNIDGSNNTAIGYKAGRNQDNGNNNTFIGYQTDAADNEIFNATALGNGAIVNGSNTIQLGNSDVTLVNTSGNIQTAGRIYAAGTIETDGDLAVQKHLFSFGPIEAYGKINVYDGIETYSKMETWGQIEAHDNIIAHEEILAKRDIKTESNILAEGIIYAQKEIMSGSNIMAAGTVTAKGYFRAVKVVSEEIYQVLSTDDVIIINGDEHTVKLPNPQGIDGRVFTIKSKGINNSVERFAGENVEDKPNIVIQRYETLTLICDGQNWWIIGRVPFHDNP
jgi:trimeric autotransporter adhesin